MSLPRRRFLTSFIKGASKSESNESQQPSLQLIQQNDPTFSSVLATSFPNASQAMWYPTLGRFLAILVNNGSARAKAYSIVWSLQTPSGQPTRLNLSYMQKHRMRWGTVKAIQPGAARLVSPFFNVSPSDLDTETPALLTAITLASEYADASITTVALSARVFIGGTQAGTRGVDLLSTYDAMRNAEHDEAYSMDQHLQKMTSPTIDSVDSILSTHVERGMSMMGTSVRATYWRSRGQEAAILRRVLSQGGLPTFRLSLDKRLTYTPTQAGTAA